MSSQQVLGQAADAVDAVGAGQRRTGAAIFARGIASQRQVAQRRVAGAEGDAADGVGTGVAGGCPAIAERECVHQRALTHAHAGVELDLCRGFVVGLTSILSSILKTTATGGVTAAISGTDFQAPLTGGSIGSIAYWTSAGAIAATSSTLYSGSYFATTSGVAGQSSFQNFTFVSATGTSATTTNLFSTNLVATNASLSTLAVTGAATSTFAAAITVGAGQGTSTFAGDSPPTQALLIH